MIKYRIYSVTACDATYYYCKQKWGPFWITPVASSLRNHIISGSMKTKNPYCKRFCTKEALLFAIRDLRIDAERAKTYKRKMSEAHHKALEII